MSESKVEACDCPLCGDLPKLRAGTTEFRYECKTCSMRSKFMGSQEAAAIDWNTKAYQAEADLFRPVRYRYN